MLARSPYDDGRDGLQQQLVVGRAISAPTPAAVPVGLLLPSHESITYTRDAMVLVLFVIAFPWVVHKLLTNPSRLLAGSGIKAGV